LNNKQSCQGSNSHVLYTPTTGIKFTKKKQINRSITHPVNATDNL